jgi:hypothetical protein
MSTSLTIAQRIKNFNHNPHRDSTISLKLPQGYNALTDYILELAGKVRNGGIFSANLVTSLYNNS